MKYRQTNTRIQQTQLYSIDLEIHTVLTLSEHKQNQSRADQTKYKKENSPKDKSILFFNDKIALTKEIPIYLESI